MLLELVLNDFLVLQGKEILFIAYTILCHFAPFMFHCFLTNVTSKKNQMGKFSRL